MSIITGTSDQNPGTLDLDLERRSCYGVCPTQVQLLLGAVPQHYLPLLLQWPVPSLVPSFPQRLGQPAVLMGSTSTHVGGIS